MLRKYLPLALICCYIITSAACTGSTAKNTLALPDSSAVETKPVGPVVLKVIMVDYGTIKNTPAEKAVLDWIGQKIGAEIQPILILPYDFDQKVNLKFAANEDFDIYPEFSTGTSQGKALQRYKAGQIISLSSYIDQYAPNMKNPDLLPPDFLDSVTFDGQVLGLPNGALLSTRYVISVRGDWLKKLGMSNVDTLDSFVGYMDKVKNTDLNGNGQKDEIPVFTGGWATGTAWKQIFLKYGGNSWIDDNGNYNIDLLDPNYKLMLSTLQDWYIKGYMVKEAYTGSEDLLRSFQLKNIFGAFAFWYTEGFNAMWALRPTVPEAENLVVLPKGPGRNELLQPQRTWGLASVTSKCKNPEKAVSLFNLLVTKEAQLVYTYGIEGVNWQYADAGKTSVNLIGVPGNDYTRAEYYLQYFSSIYSGILCPPLNTAFISESTNTLNIPIGKLPVNPQLGRSFSYDDSNWNSKKTQADRDTFIKENETKILMGQMSVDQWDNIIKQWREMGGDEYLKEIGQAYRKMSEETGKK
ncbi:MAG: extracellular solute-binding protein [Ruminiclostridium sp.]|nr:extracellular solute-binding protein [Ruminiclostridium sp.]